MIYLDHHATTPCDPRVVEAMLPWFTERFGNAGSVEHAMGREAAEAVEAARAEVAALIGAAPSEIIFTSGATESNNLAILGAARFAKGLGDERRRVITLATEHHAVLDPVAALESEGFEPVVLPVQADGLLDPAILAEAMRGPTLLVSIMAVNNEIGVVQDLAGLGRMVKAAGAAFHVDAAQASGRIPFNVSEIPADLVSLSAHKMYGPKGIGALYLRRRPRMRIAPLVAGGGQERGLRSGTIPVPLIVAFGEAARLARAEGPVESLRLRAQAVRLLGLLRAEIPTLQLNGHADRRVSGNLNLTFPEGTAAAILAAAPDLCLSSSSACTSGPDGAVGPSHVLTALGLSADAAQRSLRIGLGRFTSASDIETAAASLAAAARRAAAAARAAAA
ncbi:MAG TPA: aminotransferase class V-fold PLP-dependent enzyme [Acidisoma sp.]|uniref:cysteine desulfurase family protein n=1 Tax=Acidisoma sp. TaxID=1872115 RepID=UPI002BC6EA16|nr:aminotransferase class V-fold PLP-dependent enzyme [Acidisoma sp.]HTI03474.1 aminotransferase class V-fold PLP-dependent enzyme [Acidisoma sp.]